MAGRHPEMNPEDRILVRKSEAGINRDSVQVNVCCGIQRQFHTFA